MNDYRRHDARCECDLCRKINPHGRAGKPLSDDVKNAIIVCAAIILGMLIVAAVLQ